MQLLAERGAVGSRLGRSALAILLFQDIAVIPILVMTQAFGSAGEQSVGLDLALAAIKASIAVAVIMALGRLLLRHLFRMVIATGIRELFLALVLVTAIGTAVLTETIGLSLALGAFLAGLLVSETEYRHQIAVDIEPVKGLLLGVFFVSVGLGIDLDRVVAAPFLHLGALIGFLAVKVVILLAVCLVVGLPKSVMAELSLLLAGGSEFVFVVVGLAAGFGLLTNEVSSLIVVVVGLSMLSAPTVGVIARRLVPRLLRNETPVPDLPPEGEDGHVVIAGYGRVGRAVGGALREAGIPIAAVDADALTVGALRNAGIAIHWGNAIHRPLLKRLGTGRAAALVVTMNDTVAAADVVRVARAEWPRSANLCSRPRCAACPALAGVRRLQGRSAAAGGKLAALRGRAFRRRHPRGPGSRDHRRGARSPAVGPSAACRALSAPEALPLEPSWAHLIGGCPGYALGLGYPAFAQNETRW